MSPWIITSASLALALAVVGLVFLSQRRFDARMRYLFGGGRRNYSESLLEMERELARARRFERRLCVAVLKITHWPDEAPSPVANRTALGFSSDGLIRYLMLGATIQGQLREYDIMGFPPELDRYTVLLPECSRREAAGTAERIVERTLQTSGIRLKSGVAEFPSDGYVLEDLFRVASETSPRGEYIAIRPGVVRAGDGG